MELESSEIEIIMSQVIASQTIVSQIILGWAIKGAALMRREVVLEREKNNNSIGEKPPNPVGLRRKTKVEKIL